MIKVVLVIHLIIAAAMIAIVLMQKSEGGALGIGGGGGGAGGFLTGRGTANLLTRITAGLALGFFVTSLTLTIMASSPERGASRFQNVPAGGEQSEPQGGGGETTPGGNLLDRLKQRQGGESSGPAIPQNQ
jgi:preprotein translocase subunit SecG